MFNVKKSILRVLSLTVALVMVSSLLTAFTPYTLYAEDTEEYVEVQVLIEIFDYDGTLVSREVNYVSVSTYEIIDESSYALISPFNTVSEGQRIIFRYNGLFLLTSGTSMVTQRTPVTITYNRGPVSQVRAEITSTTLNADLGTFNLRPNQSGTITITGATLGFRIMIGGRSGATGFPATGNAIGYFSADW